MDDIKYFAKFDKDGWPTGFYPSDIWVTPPDGAVEISAIQYRALLEGNKTFANGKVVDTEDTRPV
jgi:hypothetical protein